MSSHLKALEDLRRRQREGRRIAKINKRKSLIKIEQQREQRIKNSKELSLRHFARKLNINLPKSETWFRNKFIQERVMSNKSGQTDSFIDYHGFTFNTPILSRFIGDVVSLKLRVVIEVDGSIHQKHEVRKRDNERTAFLEKQGYTVLRVDAYDDESYNKCILKLKALINKPEERKQLSTEKGFIIFKKADSDKTT